MGWNAFNKAMAKNISHRCENCGKAISYGRPKGYHGRAYYCPHCKLEFCSGCTLNKSTALCPKCGKKGQSK